MKTYLDKFWFPVLVIALVASCEKRGVDFSANEKQEKESNSSQQESDKPQFDEVETPVIADNGRIQDPEVINETPEIVIEEPEVEEIGSLEFKAALVVNMEHEAHATDAGTYVVLRDSSNKVVAVGPMTLEAAMNGKSMGGMGYPVTKLNVDLQLLDKSASSGSGKFSICLVKDTTSFECQPAARTLDAERPIHWINRSVNYTVAGNNVEVQGQAGLVNNQGVNMLSFSHPISMAALADADTWTDASSPLVFDLNKNGKLDLVAVNDSKQSAIFDLVGNGNQKHTGWIGSGDALLAIDVNGNGSIDDGTELFGEFSHEVIASKTKKVRSFTNGYLALNQYDSNKDGKIDAKDPAYKTLKLWVDIGIRGKSEKNELLSLKQAGVKSIPLNYTNTAVKGFFPRVAGNEIRYESQYEAMNGKMYSVGDVWFLKANLSASK